MSKSYQHKDILHQKAKEDGYRGRAAYKLIELNKKYKIFKGIKSVIDFGASPGGWIQVALENLQGAKIVGIDLDQIPPIEKGEKGYNELSNNTLLLIEGDITDTTKQNEIIQFIDAKADLIISDISPHLTGIKFKDAFLAAELVELVFYLAIFEKTTDKDMDKAVSKNSGLLKMNGSLIAKIFPGNETELLIKKYRPHFTKIHRINLDSSRKTSNEFYIFAEGRKG